MTPLPVLYKYASLDRGLAILRDARLYLAHPRAFNDPFELNPHFGTTVSFQVQPSGSWHSIPDAKVSDTRQLLRVQSTVVLSLSENCTSQLMWAHYAHGHTGMAIGFDATPAMLLSGSPHRLLRPVTYRSERPSAPTAMELSDEQVLWTKSAEWEDEREWRIVDSDKSADGDGEGLARDWFPFNLDPSHMRHVILGCRFDAEREVQMMLTEDRYKHVALLRAMPHEREFRIVIEAEQ